jgi:hypothetical protein
MEDNGGRADGVVQEGIQWCKKKVKGTKMLGLGGPRLGDYFPPRIFVKAIKLFFAGLKLDYFYFF